MDIIWLFFISRRSSRSSNRNYWKRRGSALIGLIERERKSRVVLPCTAGNDEPARLSRVFRYIDINDSEEAPAGDLSDRSGKNPIPGAATRLVVWFWAATQIRARFSHARQVTVFVPH